MSAEQDVEVRDLPVDVDIAHAPTEPFLLGFIVLLQGGELFFVLLEARVRRIELCLARFVFLDGRIGRLVERALLLRDVVDLALQFVALLQLRCRLALIAALVV